MLRFVAKFCRRCGNPLEAGDLFCGECGAKVPGAAGDPDEPTQAGEMIRQDEDFFDAWDKGLPQVSPEEPSHRPDEAVTESIATARPGDTAVLPTAPAEPYLDPGAPRPAVPPHDAAAPGGAQVYPPKPAPRPRQGFPLGATLALIGALAVIISALLPWSSGISPEFGPVLYPRDIEFANVVTGSAERLSGPSVGIVLLGAGLLGALVALVTMLLPLLKFLRRIIGLLTLAIPVLFVVRAVQEFALLNDAGLAALSLDTILALLDVGVYVAAAGAFTQMVAGKWFRR
jgi:hypothetical protein